MLLEIDSDETASVSRPELQAPDERGAFVRKFDIVPVSMTLDDTVYSSKKPRVRFMIEPGYREDRRTIEVIAAWPVFLPALPLFIGSDEYFERLILAVPLSEMYLKVSRAINLPNIFEMYYRKDPVVM